MDYKYDTRDVLIDLYMNDDQASVNGFEHIHELVLYIEELQSRIAELEKDAARMDWMQDNYLCADFMYGETATEIVAIEFPSKSKFCGDLRTEIDAAMQKD